MNNLTRRPTNDDLIYVPPQDRGTTNPVARLATGAGVAVVGVIAIWFLLKVVIAAILSTVIAVAAVAVIAFLVWVAFFRPRRR